MKREEDIFKKLDRQKPLIKQSQQNRPIRESGSRQSGEKRELEIPAAVRRNSKRTGSQTSSRVEIRRVQPAQIRESEWGASSRDARRNRDADTQANRSIRPVQQEFSPQIQKQSSPSRQERTIRAASEIQPSNMTQAAKKQRAQTPVDDFQEQIVDKAAFTKDKELKFRHEMKYYINYRDYWVVRQSLKAVLLPDENGDENNTYHIRSLYFDDRDETALTDKLAGVEARCKYRIRIYNHSRSIIRLEKKIKQGQYIAKKSIPLTYREYQALLARQYAFLLRRKEPLAKELYLQFTCQQLAPRVVVDYQREAYVMDYERVRITFDKDLKSGKPGDIFDPNLNVWPIGDQGMMVLEVKFNRYLPDYVRRILDNLSSTNRTAISKYVLCRKYD